MMGVRQFIAENSIKNPAKKAGGVEGRQAAHGRLPPLHPAGYPLLR